MKEQPAHRLRLLFFALLCAFLVLTVFLPLRWQQMFPPSSDSEKYVYDELDKSPREDEYMVLLEAYQQYSGRQFSLDEFKSQASFWVCHAEKSVDLWKIPIPAVVYASFSFCLIDDAYAIFNVDPPVYTLNTREKDWSFYNPTFSAEIVQNSQECTFQSASKSIELTSMARLLYDNETDSRLIVCTFLPDLSNCKAAYCR